METLSQFSKTKFRESLTQFLWDQWVVLGGAGATTAGSVPFVVDPEALILITTRFGMSESRLREICFDWLSSNGGLVSVQRLKNIQKIGDLADGEKLRTLAEYAVENGFPNWKSVIALTPENLSLSENRTRYSPRQMSRAPCVVDSAAFLFKARNFFGMSARAEVLLWLVTHESGHAALIAKQTVWLPKTIQLILNEWQAAGVVTVYEGAREKTFRINKSEENHFLNFTREDEINWLNQTEFYRGIVELDKILTGLETVGDRGVDFAALQIFRGIKKVAGHFGNCQELDVFPPFDHFGDSRVLIDHFESQMELFQEEILDRRQFSRR